MTVQINVLNLLLNVVLDVFHERKIKNSQCFGKNNAATLELTGQSLYPRSTQLEISSIGLSQSPCIITCICEIITFSRPKHQSLKIFENMQDLVLC